ncbi:MAG: hypothetical protein ABSD41_05570 [Candidatus Bathyarchaeia archaeon]
MRLVSILLILMVTTVLAPTTLVLSQSYSTYTSFMTSTNTQLSTISIGTTTLSELTTSAFNSTSGTIPPALESDVTGLWTCYYFPYKLHIDASVKEVDGTLSASSPVNMYIMSNAQYNQFVTYNPPCESSFLALQLEYSTKSYVLKWAPPSPGDYYIIMENTSASAITYTVQISTIQNQSIAIFSTHTILQIATSLKTQTDTITTSSNVGPQPALSDNVPLILIVIASISAVVLLIRSRLRRKMRKEEGPGSNTH